MCGRNTCNCPGSTKVKAAFDAVFPDEPIEEAGARGKEPSSPKPAEKPVVSLLERVQRLATDLNEALLQAQEAGIRIDIGQVSNSPVQIVLSGVET